MPPRDAPARRSVHDAEGPRADHARHFDRRHAGEDPRVSAGIQRQLSIARGRRSPEAARGFGLHGPDSDDPLHPPGRHARRPHARHRDDGVDGAPDAGIAGRQLERLMQTRLARTGVLVAVMLMGAARAEAQATWGVKGGVNWSKVAWDDTVVLDTPYTFGIVAGAFIRLTPMKVPLQIEGLVSQVVIDYSTGGSSVKDTVTYAEVPVLWRAVTFKGSGLKTTVVGGANFDVRIYGQENVNGATEKISDAFAPWGVSLVGGADVDWGAHWVFGARYLFGLTDIYDSVIAVDFPAKQRGFQFTAGWRF